MYRDYEVVIDRVDDRAGGRCPTRIDRRSRRDLQPARARGCRWGSTRRIRLHDPTLERDSPSSDFEIDSPYNTRLHTGLPPTPIASPGVPSLRAALNPADVPYLYYVLCSSNGAHRFA